MIGEGVLSIDEAVMSIDNSIQADIVIDPFTNAIRQNGPDYGLDVVVCFQL